MSPVDRSAAPSMAWMWRRAGLPGPSSSRSSSACIRMAVSMLLLSWATPPASRPMDSSFWDWFSCSCRRARSSSACFRSVMSSNTPSTA